VEGSVAQAVSKLGVLKLVELVAEEYRHENVRANAIVPSIIDTPANRKAMPKGDHSKWISPTAIGEVLRFLMSDEARIVSGATIPVYGEV
jgi:NAD(P)-dependent dehydrogenase (short-subunit alcohol dehydrogenase family)